jgi:LAO/AO transport system kinase
LPRSDTDDLAAALRGGSRRALARAVTLVESTRADHRAEAERLIEAILPATGGATRIGITGPPGAGKSTFIERFARRHRLHGSPCWRSILGRRGGGAILATRPG